MVKYVDSTLYAVWIFIAYYTLVRILCLHKIELNNRQHGNKTEKIPEIVQRQYRDRTEIVQIINGDIYIKNGYSTEVVWIQYTYKAEKEHKWNTDSNYILEIYDRDITDL